MDGSKSATSQSHTSTTSPPTSLRLEGQVVLAGTVPRVQRLHLHPGQLDVAGVAGDRERRTWKTGLREGSRGTFSSSTIRSKGRSWCGKRVEHGLALAAHPRAKGGVAVDGRAQRQGVDEVPHQRLGLQPRPPRRRGPQHDVALPGPARQHRAPRPPAWRRAWRSRPAPARAGARSWRAGISRATRRRGGTAGAGAGGRWAAPARAGAPSRVRRQKSAAAASRSSDRCSRCQAAKSAYCSAGSGSGAPAAKARYSAVISRAITPMLHPSLTMWCSHQQRVVVAGRPQQPRRKSGPPAGRSRCWRPPGPRRRTLPRVRRGQGVTGRPPAAARAAGGSPAPPVRRARRRRCAATRGGGRARRGAAQHAGVQRAAQREGAGM